MGILNERLVALMNAQGLNQKEFAAKIGVTESTMSYYVKGLRTPRSKVLAKMAAELGTSTDYLLGVSNIEKVPENRKLLYLQRNLGKLDPEKLEKAETILKVVFDDIFDDEE